MAALPQQALTFTDVFEEEDVEEVKEAQTVHHIRANSSIMHLKKILGMSLWPSLPTSRPLLRQLVSLQPLNCCFWLTMCSST